MHEPVGVLWTPEGASVLCKCEWASEPPTPISRGWIEELQRQYEEHLETA